MQYKSLRPILWSDKWQETLDFYNSVLDFAIREKNEEWQWASLYKDDVEIMIAKPNEHMPFEKPCFTGSLYINTDQADELWSRLKDKTTVIYPIETFPWQMREFAIADNNGYIIQFGQPTED